MTTTATPLTQEQTQTFNERYSFPLNTTFETLEPSEESRRAKYRREDWPAGPWDREPFDKVVWVDPDTGLDCMLIRGPMGSWCGYVGITNKHPWFGVEYSVCTKGCKPPTQKQQVYKYRRARERAKSAQERKMWQSLVNMTLRMYHPRTECNHHTTPESILNVHGGVTYSGHCFGVICRPHKEGEDAVFWYGFDTAHAWDLVPGRLALDRTMGFETHRTEDGSMYRDMAYCKQEVEALAAQLKLQGD